MRRLLFAFLVAAAPAKALELTLPNAIVARSETIPQGQVRLPEAPWSPDARPATAEGEITRRILRVPIGALTPLQLIEGLRTILEEEGYSEVFGCANAACGGFDFRFQLDILGEPDMHVDLGNFVYLLMRSPEADAVPHTVALIASRTQTTGFVHITTVSEPTQTDMPDTLIEPDQPVEQATTETPGLVPDLILSLTGRGHAVLGDLDFGTGSAELGAGPFASLEALAEWLGQNPSASIVLVGHTDSVGSLEANTALSRRRAASVARYLTLQLGADPEQIQSSGAGFLAPVASNLSDEGRAANRRVEVVLLSLDQ